ncbi:hypothetical protein EMWEY_00022240 [Eimeria maxima]|uniref:Uncharacterized protein n=1 Tax=Eimeria maxima TaxID=5804 RepID=U6MAD2_EIMMA|nr:hypothetical protein EMWEY_00022240 [Eimeria maxima]CDJ59454.1 hypothetical protein EMWEY_00022240 [Eimeria maxima]
MESSLHARQEPWTGVADPAQQKCPPRSREHSLSLRVVFATTISVVAILVSFSTCKALRSREHLAGEAQRRLAEGEQGPEKDVNSIVEGCLDLEAAMGVLQQGAVSSSRGEPPHRATQLVSMLSEAEAKESVSGSLPAESQLHPGEKEVDDHNCSEPEVDKPVHAHNPPTLASVERGKSTVVASALDPEPWIGAIPRIDPHSSEQEMDESSSATDDESETDEESDIPPRKRRRVRGFKEIIWSGDIRSHPYVRLPVLEEGVVPKNLEVSTLFYQRPLRLSLYANMLAIRNLFAKETLNQNEADHLVTVIEKVVPIVWLQGQRGPRGRSPIHTVEHLGNCFIAFDAILSAAEILGNSMQLHLWWDDFTASFDTTFRLTPPGLGLTELAEFHAQFSRRIIVALNTYKTGERPPLEEVVALKRLLFCYPLGRHRLKDPRWDPWRRDGECSS